MYRISFYWYREQIVMTCEVLSQLLSTLEPSLVFMKYKEALQRALGHPAPRVKQLAIDQVCVL